jgi:hypothetical protein
VYLVEFVWVPGQSAPYVIADELVRHFGLQQLKNWPNKADVADVVRLARAKKQRQQQQWTLLTTASPKLLATPAGLAARLGAVRWEAFRALDKAPGGRRAALAAFEEAERCLQIVATRMEERRDCSPQQVRRALTRLGAGVAAPKGGGPVAAQHSPAASSASRRSTG